MQHYFVPMLVEEFNNLLRLGRIKILPGRWLYASPVEVPYLYESHFFQELKEITPTFEDTISIVIVEFSRCPPCAPKKYAFMEFLFEDALATYALTDHDVTILTSRFSSYAKLSTKLLIEEKAVQQWNQELFETESLNGARSLLVIYQGKHHPFMDEIEVDALCKALRLRKNDCVLPIKNSSYLDHLICYSRSGSTPNTDTGFLYDCALVLKYYLSPKSPEQFGVKEAIEYHQSVNSTLADIANALGNQDIARRFDDYAALPGALVSSLVFLKLCHLVRECPDALNRKKLRDLFGVIDDQSSVARGVWWCGGFWGFTPFAREYYAIAPLQENLEFRWPSPAVVGVPAVIQPDAPMPESPFAEPILAVPTKPTEPVKSEPARPLAEERVPEVMESVSESRAVAVAPIPSLLVADGVALPAQAPDVSATPTDSPGTGLQVASGAEGTIEVEAAPIPDAPPGVPATAPRPEPTSPATLDVPGCLPDVVASKTASPSPKTRKKGLFPQVENNGGHSPIRTMPRTAAENPRRRPRPTLSRKSNVPDPGSPGYAPQRKPRDD